MTEQDPNTAEVAAPDAAQDESPAEAAAPEAAQDASPAEATAPEAAQGQGAKGLLGNRSLVISAVLTFVVLAGVIAAVALFGPFKPVAPEQKVDKHQALRESQGRTFLARAQAASQSGNTTAAGELAAQAYAIDPTNKEAKAFVERIRRKMQQETDRKADELDPKPVTPGEGSGNLQSGGVDVADAGAWDRGWESKVESVTPLLPDAFPKWAMGAVVVHETDPSVSAEPYDRTPKAVRIVWSMHELADAAAADGYVARSRATYPKNPAEVEIDGAPGYFGTDGKTYATITFARGRYAFDVLVTGAKGVKPKSLKSLAASAAKTFRDSPE